MPRSSALDKGEAPIADLSNEEVLALTNLMMDEADDEELDELLALQRESAIDDAGRKRLDELMQVYRRGMVRRSEALMVAVQRGLTPPLS